MLIGTLLAIAIDLLTSVKFLIPAAITIGGRRPAKSGLPRTSQKGTQDRSLIADPEQETIRTSEPIDLLQSSNSVSRSRFRESPSKTELELVSRG